jgi:tetratricopeptide (TPR) repeat protein
MAEFISQDHCALFVGPDLGESADGYRGLPTSWQIADELATLSGYRGRFRSLPQIAQIFANKYGHPALEKYLRKQLDVPDYRPLPVHELIARIPFSVIVYGGWDTLLEQAIKGQQTRFHTIRQDIDPIFRPSGERQLLLYQPYGSVDIPGSLLVTEDDQLSVFYQLKRVIERMKIVMEEHALLLVGYAPAQDATFTRLYYEIRRTQPQYLLPAVAVQSLSRAEDAAAWEARGVTAIVEEPAAFLQKLAKAVAKKQGRKLALPDIESLSTAPRLTPMELKEQADVLNSMMDQIGVADLVEQTNIPLLSEEQLRDIEAMRAAYERLAETFTTGQNSAHVWLRQGNLEYARENYSRAEEYYRRTLAVEPRLAEAYHNLHYVQLALDDWSGALESYQQAIALRPELAIVPARYQIEAVLGGSGMGVVYRARDMQTEQQVAIKILQRAKAQTEQVLAVFKREAHVLQNLDHPNIVRMTDFQSYQGNYFIVMEYLEGQSLKAALQTRSEPFALDHTFCFIEQVGEALEYAHTQGIIHRDVKPSNILLTGDQARLIDFGLARPLAPGEQSTLNAVVGTVTYLAPEQALGQSTDCRTDVYGVASVFYEMLTKRNPSQGTYHAPSELLPGLNSALDLVIEKARERDPNDRYSTVKAFLNELRQVVSMQAASESAPWTLRLVARAAQAAKVGIERGWLGGVAAIAVLGFVLPELWPSAFALREIARYIAAAFAIMLMSGIVAGPFTMTLARRMRSAVIAAYGPAIGLMMGAVNSLLWLRSFSFKCALPEQRLGYAEIESYLILIISSLVLSLSVAVAVFLLLPVAGALTRRLGKTYAVGFFIAYLLFAGTLLILGISLKFGWFGDVSLITPECLEHLQSTP